MLHRKLITSGLATLAVLATTAIASAAPAYVTSNVNVRSGPSTAYGVVDTLRRGDRVDVQQCRGSWCFVEKPGPDGWVSSNYLERGGRPGWNPRPDRDDDWFRPPPPRPPQWDNPRPPYWGNPRPPRPPSWNDDYWDPRPPAPRPIPIYPDRPSGSVCFNGPNGYFCAGN